MRTHRTRALLAATVAGLTLTACGGGHSDHDDSAAAQQTPTSGQHDMAAMGDTVGDGLAAAAGGYTIADVSAPRTTGKKGKLEFVINGPSGKPHKEFVLELTKLMHTYVVRKDLSEFQHVHPELNKSTGRWSVPISFAEPGPYRVVSEFEALQPDGNFASRMLGAPFTVGGRTYKATAYKPSFGKSAIDGYDLALEPQAPMHGPDLTMKITKDGSDVKDLQPYLESWAHVTGFRKGDLKVVHMHPQQSPKDANALGGPILNLASMFKAAGEYRLFVQFQTAGKLHTTPIDIKITGARAGGTTPAATADASASPAAEKVGEDSMPKMTAEEQANMEEKSDAGHSGH